MIFYSQEIERMDRIMKNWADYWRDRRRTNVSITWVACMSVRAQRFDWRAFYDPENPRRGLSLGQPTKVPRVVDAVEAEKARKLIHDPQKWQGHKDERRLLVVYYLKVRPSEPIGSIAKKLDCKPWQVEKKMNQALYYLSKIWRDE